MDANGCWASILPGMSAELVQVADPATCTAEIHFIWKVAGVLWTDQYRLQRKKSHIFMQIVSAGSEETSPNISHICSEFETTNWVEASIRPKGKTCECVVITRND